MLGRILVAAGISASLAVLAVSSVVLLAAAIGLMVTRSEGAGEARRKFVRMFLGSLMLALVSGAFFWWISKGATVPLFRY